MARKLLRLFSSLFLSWFLLAEIMVVAALKVVEEEEVMVAVAAAARTFRSDDSD
jgi:hypothetical protein